MHVDDQINSWKLKAVMPIQKITENMWDQILRLETQAYKDIEPESLETLRSKWEAS